MPVEPVLASRGPPTGRKPRSSSSRPRTSGRRSTQEPAARQRAWPELRAAARGRPGWRAARAVRGAAGRALTGVRPARQITALAVQARQRSAAPPAAALRAEHRPRVLRVLTTMPAPGRHRDDHGRGSSARGRGRWPSGSSGAGRAGRRAAGAHQPRGGSAPTSRPGRPAARRLRAKPPRARGSPWQRLYLRPEPHGHRSLRLTLAYGSSGGVAVPLDAAALGRGRVLQVARPVRLEAGRKHRLRPGCPACATVSVTPASARAGSAAVGRRCCGSRPRRGPPPWRGPARRRRAGRGLPPAAGRRPAACRRRRAGPTGSGCGRRASRAGRRAAPGRGQPRRGAGRRLLGRPPVVTPGRAAAERELRARADLLDDRVLLDLELEVEQVADRLFLDAVHHRVEHVVALPLVLDQRVALRHGAQADALAEVVHLVQVLAPLAVEDRQHDAPLDLAHHVRRELGLAAVVGLLRVLLHHAR